MKQIAIAVLLLGSMTCLQTKAQILKPVHWTYTAKKLNAGEAMLSIKATIDEDWHVYSQHIKDGGPVKTSFTFTPSPDYTLEGVTAEPKPIVKMEPVFSMEIGYFAHSVTFQQKIKLKRAQTTVTGKLEYMTCNDHQCLPPEDIDFSIVVK